MNLERIPVLIRKETVDVLFHCMWAHGALVIDKKMGKPLCTNNRHWPAKGTRVDETTIRVESGGYCPECGDIGQAMIRDEYDGCVVEVAG